MSISETNPEREELITQVLSARTLPEIASAEQSLRHWLEQHPEDVGLEDAFEQLSMLQDCAEWLAENPAEAERVESARRVSAQVYRAQTLGEIAPARGALDRWRRDHPDDDRLNTEALFLDLLEEALTDVERKDDHATSERAKTPAHV